MVSALNFNVITGQAQFAGTICVQDNDRIKLSSDKQFNAGGHG
jgi:hypothetical protein